MTECHCGKDGHPLHSINCPACSAETIERAAKAIWDAEFDREVTSPWGDQSHLQKQFYRMLASAAIDAARR
jgi:ribosomal protein L37AE/L43A